MWLRVREGSHSFLVAETDCRPSATGKSRGHLGASAALKMAMRHQLRGCFQTLPYQALGAWQPPVGNSFSASCSSYQGSCSTSPQCGFLVPLNTSFLSIPSLPVSS